MASGAASAPAAPPVGIVPLNFSAKHMDKYGMKNGPGLRDTIPFKVFSKQTILEEIQAVGFYSAFNDIKAQIQGFPGEEILVVADPTERYGENWYVCVSEESKAREMEAMTAAEREAEAAARAAAEEEARKAAEAQALEKLIVHEEPRVAKPYSSLTSQATVDEVRALGVRQSRPLLAVRIQRRRYAFGARCSFNDRESDIGLAEFRPRKEPGYEMKRKEMSIGLQMCPSSLSGRVDASAQTQWNAPQNASVSVDMDSSDAAEELMASHPLSMALNGIAAVGAVVAAEDSATDVPTKIDSSSLRAMLQETVQAAASLEAGAAAELPPASRAGRSSSIAVAGSDALMQPSALLMRRSSAGSALGVASAGVGGGFSLGGFGVGGTGGKTAATSAMERLVDFMYRALPMCEQALSQNETLNIFRNELTLLAEDEVMVMGNSEAKHIREERQFMDLELSNNKALVAVEWHPASPVWLAVAAMPRHVFERRVLESALPRTSHILLYTLTEFSNQLVLEAPADVTCMHWNPRNANIMAIGCITGQVAVFDMSEAHEAMAARRKASAAAADGGRASTSSEDGGTSSKALHVKPKFVSAVETSHGRAVTGLRWLPSSHHLSLRNQFMPERDHEVYQFVTVGSDGMVAVWDTRFRERTRTRRRASIGGAEPAAAPAAAGAVGRGGAADSGALQSTLVPGAAAAGVPTPPAEVPWAPQYRVVIRFGAGPVNMTSFLLHDKEPTEPLFAGTEEGKLLVIDWAPPGEGSGAEEWLSSTSAAPSGGAAAGKEGASGADAPLKSAPSLAAAAADDTAGGENAASSGSAMRVLWVAQDGDRPPVAMQRSPFWPDIFLTVSEFSFSIWRRGVKSPVFTSSASPVPNTTGRWSPSRPAVIFIGRSDGFLDVWDLLDSTTKPTVSFPIMSLPVTSMEFRTTSTSTATATVAHSGGLWATATASTASAGPGHSSIHAGNKQLLAVGDAKGSLHVLDIPLPLRKGVPNEEAVAAAYLDREVARVNYGTTRTAFHEAEMARLDAEEARQAAIRETAAAKLEADLQQARTALAEKDPAAARALDAAAFQRQKQEAARIAQEDKYLALEKSIMDSLGVQESELFPISPQRRVTTEAPPPGAAPTGEISPMSSQLMVPDHALTTAAAKGSTPGHKATATRATVGSRGTASRTASPSRSTRAGTEEHKRGK